MNEPFKATALWTAILDHLKTNLLTRKNRHRLRIYEQSFTGTEAVEVIHKFLTSNSHNLLNNKQIERENALKVCQVLLKEKIFESSNREKKNFEDSSTKFYIFTTNIKPQTTPRSSLSLRRALQNDNEDPKSIFYEPEIIVNPQQHFTKIHRSSLRKLKPGPVLKRLSSFSHRPRDENHVELTSVGALKRTWTVATLSASAESLNKRKNAMNETREILLKKLALARLLSIIEVPYLEDLLPLVNDKNDNGDVFQPSFLNTMTIYDDKWLSAAQSCIDVPLASCRPAVSWSKREWKKATFKLVIEDFKKNKMLLIPQSLQTIFLQIYGLLKENKTQVALQALQFACLLLSQSQRNKLYRVLVFMDSVAEDNSVRLSKFVSNQCFVLRELSSFVMNFPLLGPEQVFTIIYLMFKQCKIIFKVPNELLSEVERILNSDDESIGFSSCQQISLDTYEKQKKETTETSLRNLLETKLRDRLTSTRDKSKWLHKFQKSHLEIYDSYLKKS